MSQDNQLSYGEVVAIANRLVKEGKRVTLEYLRRELGKGTHAQIAVFLGKWQKEYQSVIAQHKKEASPASHSHSATNDYRNRFDKKESQTRQNRQNNHHSGLKRPDMSSYKERRQKQTHTNNHQSQRRQHYHASMSFQNESHKKDVDTSKMTQSRLQEEAQVIQKLFMALAHVKAEKSQALEYYQATHQDLLNFRMQSDQEIREFKKGANTKINALLSEFNYLKMNYERQTVDLRKKSALSPFLLVSTQTFNSHSN